MKPSYQELMEKSNACVTKAIDLIALKNYTLAKFWYNASEAYKDRARNTEQDLRNK